MVYEIDDDEYIVILAKQGDYRYILNDIVYLLRVENEHNSHYIFIDIKSCFTREP